MVRPTTAIALAGLIAASAHAADTSTPPLSEDAFFGELPLVLTVTRLAQPQSETPAAITVIDRDLIRASGARRVADLFWLVPGFQVGYDHGATATVTYHGLSDEFARRMQVLIDGRSVYDPVFGGVFWLGLPLALADIERIEVIRGPNAVSYGSNAFLGTINITTRHASREPHSRAEVAIGEHDIRDGSASYAWSSARGHSRLTAAYQQDDGFDDLPDSSRVRLFNYRGDYRLSARDTLELQLGGNGTTHGEGHTGAPLDGPRDADVTNHFQLARWRRALAPDNELGVQLYRTYWKNEEAYVTDPVAAGALGVIQVPVNFDGTQERTDVEVQQVVRPSGAWRYVWGGGLRLDRARSRTGFAMDDTVDNRVYRLFGNVEWRARTDTIVNAGAMWEKDGISGAELLPRIALNHHLSPQQTLRVAASRATRTPAMIEEHGDVRFATQGMLLNQTIAARGGLQAEIMKSYELGYLGQWRDKTFSVDARLFRDRMHDLITELVVPAADLDGSAFDYRNEGRADITGAELQLHYRVTPATRLIANVASMRAKVSGLSAQAHFDAARHERSVPDYTASLLAMHRWNDRWDGSISYHRVAAMEWLGSGGHMDDYGRIDVRVARELRLGRARGHLAMTIQNLGNDTASFHPENVFDRRAFVTLTVGD